MGDGTLGAVSGFRWVLWRQGSGERWPRAAPGGAGSPQGQAEEELCAREHEKQSINYDTLIVLVQTRMH